MGRDHETSTIIDTEFDVIEELNGVVDEIENALKDREHLLEKIDYMRFLIKELDDSLSGQYEALRRRRFITKKSD